MFLPVCMRKITGASHLCWTAARILLLLLTAALLVPQLDLEDIRL